jgi:hypothetical protein
VVQVDNQASIGVINDIEVPIVPETWGIMETTRKITIDNQGMYFIINDVMANTWMYLLDQNK